MLRRKGGQAVRKGTYIRLNTGDFVMIDHDGGILPGEVDTTYVRTPALMIMLLGPLLGLGLVIFMPLIGILMVSGFVAARIGQATTGAARKMVMVAAPNWVAGVSYLDRGERRGGKATKTEERPEQREADWVSDLEKEVLARKQQHKN